MISEISDTWHLADAESDLTDALSDVTLTTTFEMEAHLNDPLLSEELRRIVGADDIRSAFERLLAMGAVAGRGPTRRSSIDQAQGVLKVLPILTTCRSRSMTRTRGRRGFCQNSEREQGSIV